MIIKWNSHPCLVIIRSKTPTFFIQINLLENFPPCPKCNCEFTYPTGNFITCPECFHEWAPVAEVEADDSIDNNQVLDSNGNPLQDGDTVIVIKDLPVKGATKPVIKAGTKVKNIRLVDDDHDIACKIDGFGAMGLKSEFVRKA